MALECLSKKNNPDIRSALFGNLEKIRDFHQDLLLPDLERSKLRSSKIASIFLKYVSNTFMTHSHESPPSVINMSHKRDSADDSELTLKVSALRSREVILDVTNPNHNPVSHKFHSVDDSELTLKVSALKSKDVTRSFWT